MTILVTGGAGFIGSHTIVELLAAGYEVVCVDNFCNSLPSVNRRVEQIAGRAFEFHEADVTDEAAMRRIFASRRIDCAIHFAAFKSVPESVSRPLEYYDNNLNSLLTLCRTMTEAGCRQIIFSSSATVYGMAEKMPLTEDAPTSAINPYGQTKLMAEQILRDLAKAMPELSAALLRYFNPIGAHPSGLIGESPHDIPANLLPRVAQVAYGLLPSVPVTGTDFPTPDGTGVRDYIHIVDLAKGHVAAIEKLHDRPGVHTYNLGTGRGYSVLEVIAAMERACGHSIPCVYKPRRPGDTAVCYADASKAERELGWKAELTLDDACRDLCRWQAYFKSNLIGKGAAL